MSATLKVVDQIVEIPVRSIDRDPDQPRDHFDLSEIEALSQNLGVMTQLEPIVVRPTPRRRNHYTIVSGERRWRAAKMLGDDTLVHARIIKGLTRDQIYDRQVAENAHRSDFSPIELATIMKHYLDERGYTIEQVCTTVGKTEPDVYGHLALLNLPIVIQAAVNTGDVPITAAYELTRLRDSLEIDELMALAREVVKGEISIADLRSAKPGKSHKGKKPGKRRPPKEAAAIIGKIRGFTDKNESIPAVLRALLEKSDSQLTAASRTYPDHVWANLTSRLSIIGGLSQAAAERLQSLPRRDSLTAAPEHGGSKLDLVKSMLLPKPNLSKARLKETFGASEQHGQEALKLMGPRLKGPQKNDTLAEFRKSVLEIYGTDNLSEILRLVKKKDESKDPIDLGPVIAAMALETIAAAG